ncbi:MAG: hypothetical protein UH963_10225 [Agathobacter sp.]|nr:hypothetical protein [Agathobacter sp.]
MLGFFSCFMKYIVEMIILAFVAFVGAMIGIKLRKNKNSKSPKENIDKKAGV